MHTELHTRVAALRFHDIGALAREVKGESLGIDIHRHFKDSKGKPGGTKGAFASWVLDNLDNELVEAGLPPYEKEASAYYAGKEAKTTRQIKPAANSTVVPTLGPAKPTITRDVPMPTITRDIPTAAPASDFGQAFNAILQQAVEQAVSNGAKLNADQHAAIMASVDARIEHELASVKPFVITVTDGTSTVTKQLPRQHKQFTTLLKLASAKRKAGRFNIWMTGPAGSGKTTAAENVADTLNIPYGYCGAIVDEFKLLGFTAANGQTVRTPFREIFEHGGVFLMDEMDGSSPSACLAFAAALANGYCDFPDGRINRHEDCVILAAGNTWGSGATREYVGRNELDAATLDRFITLHWDYDEELERETCGNKEWAIKVQAYRTAVHGASIQHMVTPRASYDGAVLLASGFSEDDVISMMIKRGLSDTQWQTVQSRAVRGY